MKFATAIAFSALATSALANCFSTDLCGRIQAEGLLCQPASGTGSCATHPQNLIYQLNAQIANGGASQSKADLAAEIRCQYGLGC